MTEPRPIDELEAFGIAFALARKRRHLNQGDVADLAGVGRVTIARFETNAVGVELRTLLALCKAIGITLGALEASAAAIREAVE